ncbi:MAG: transcriptional repressor NrdR [Candidatus Aenigmarchaeota archaeon]|nr:transcriptional repressor NrdR [Candidatus Aenigmarchaeota archaeon]
MLCPHCKKSKSRVIDKRDTEEDKIIRRRRQCLKCKNRFTTYERAILDLIIIKKGGKRERFDREKLKTGIMKACEKRPVSLRKIERIVNEVEAGLRKLHKTEIKSRVIGDLVMKKLKMTDKVAFVRFASYYKHFNDVPSFKKSLR